MWKIPADFQEFDPQSGEVLPESEGVGYPSGKTTEETNNGGS